MGRIIYLFFLGIPIFILLFFAWRMFDSYDMVQELENQQQSLTAKINEQPELMAPLTPQESIMIRKDEELLFTIVNHETQEITYEEMLESNPFNDVAVAYQEDGIALLTKGGILHAYFLQDAKLDSLALPNLSTDTYLHQSTIIFNDVIFSLVENDSILSVLAIHNGQMEVQTLEQLTGLADIVDARILPHSKIPVIQVNFYEGDNLLIGLGVDPELHVIATAPDDHEGRLTIEAAIYQSPTFIKLFGTDIQLVDKTTLESSTLDIPLFYPQVFPISASETVIIGQEDLHTEDNYNVGLYQNDGTLLQSFTTQSSSELEVIAHRNNNIYAGSSTAAGLFHENNYHTFTLNDYNATSIEEVTQIEQKIKEQEKNPAIWSEERMVSFIKNNESFRNISYVTIIYIIVVVIIAGTIKGINLTSKRRIERAYANGGGKIFGTISSVVQTGTYINEQPVVSALVLFTFNRENLKGKVKYTANLISPPKPGDRIEIVYDPVKDKLYKV